MTLKEILQKLGEKRNARKELLRQADEQLRIQKILQDREKSANERELERFNKEDREEQITKALEVARVRRREDINFNHNPLDVQNITNHTDFEVLKQKNQFSGNSNMFANQKMIHKNNPNLNRTNQKMFQTNHNLLNSNMGLMN